MLCLFSFKLVCCRLQLAVLLKHRHLFVNQQSDSNEEDDYSSFGRIDYPQVSDEGTSFGSHRSSVTFDVRLARKSSQIGVQIVRLIREQSLSVETAFIQDRLVRLPTRYEAGRSLCCIDWTTAECLLSIPVVSTDYI
jgi:hypothetical protein